jgi:hypothetical protein
MPNSSTVAFVCPRWTPGSPAVHLLDRFLSGYPRDGEFQIQSHRQVRIVGPHSSSDPILEKRSADYRIQFGDIPGDANGVVVFPETTSAKAHHDLVKSALLDLKPGASCFVYGCLALTAAGAASLLEIAGTRNVRLTAGTAATFASHVPEIPMVGLGSSIKRGLVVIPGSGVEAHIEGWAALGPLGSRAVGPRLAVKQILRASGADVWSNGGLVEWVHELLPAAISRSDSPLGDSVTDGRTQDLAGLGMVSSMAGSASLISLELMDGNRLASLAVTKVVGDACLALRLDDDGKISAQLHRTPWGAASHYHRLAAGIDDFFAGAPACASPDWHRLTAQVIEAHLG